MKIKLKPKDLRGKTDEELIKMIRTLKLHLTKCRAPKNRDKGNEGYDIPEVKKNIARIKTILNEK